MCLYNNVLLTHALYFEIKYCLTKKLNILYIPSSTRIIFREHSLVSLILLFLLQVIFLIGNKSDLEAQRDVTYEEAKQFADENGVYYC